MWVDSLGDIALTANRVATGAFFLFSGYHKLFNAMRRKSLVDTLTSAGIPFISVMQWFVPTVEFLGGLAVVFGFLTRIAAFGLIIISLVAAVTDGWKRVKSWLPISTADTIDDVLYLPEVLYVLLLLPFLVNGAGPYSFDAIGSHLLGQ